MRITTIAAVAIAVAMSASADEVTVYVQGLSVVPAPVLSRAQALSNEIFAGVGVKIDWRRGAPSHSQSRIEKPIVVEITTGTPSELKPGALAFAHPSTSPNAFTLPPERLVKSGVGLDRRI